MLQLPSTQIHTFKIEKESPAMKKCFALFLLVHALLFTGCTPSSSGKKVEISPAEYAYLLPNNFLSFNTDETATILPGKEIGDFQLKQATVTFDPLSETLVTFSRTPYVHQWETPQLTVSGYLPYDSNLIPVYKTEGNSENFSKEFEYNTGEYLLSQITIGAQITDPNKYLNDNRELVMNEQGIYSPKDIDEYTHTNIYLVVCVQVQQKIISLTADDITRTSQSVIETVKIETTNEFNSRGINIQLLDVLLVFPPK